MGNLMDSMKKAQEIAKQAEVVNKELMETIVIGNGKKFPRLVYTCVMKR
jgi:hypothetical protein